MGPTVIKLMIVMAVLAFFVHMFACFYWRVKVEKYLVTWECLVYLIFHQNLQTCPSCGVPEIPMDNVRFALQFLQTARFQQPSRYWELPRCKEHRPWSAFKSLILILNCYCLRIELFFVAFLKPLYPSHLSIYFVLIKQLLGFEYYVCLMFSPASAALHCFLSWVSHGPNSVLAPAFLFKLPQTWKLRLKF